MSHAAAPSGPDQLGPDGICAQEISGCYKVTPCRPRNSSLAPGVSVWSDSESYLSDSDWPPMLDSTVWEDQAQSQGLGLP